MFSSKYPPGFGKTLSPVFPSVVITRGGTHIFPNKCGAERVHIRKSMGVRVASRSKPGARLTQSAKIKVVMDREQLKGYLYSVPERLLRSLTGLGGGAAREVSDVLLPARVRRSRLYQSLVGSTLRFLIEQVGQIEGAYLADADAEALPSDFLIRRAAGNVLELAGIASFRASPVWVLAALADLAGVGRELIGEMAEALQKEGLLEPGHEFQTVDQLLDGLERTAGRLTETVNTPPLDVASLRAEWAAIRREASRIPRSAMPVDRLYGQWRELQQEAEAQGRSVLQLSSVMALAVVRELPENVRWLSRAAQICGRRAGEVLASGLLDYYRQSLAEIRDVGYVRYWLREFRPYWNGAVRQFSTKQVSTTERFLSRRRTRKNSLGNED